MSRPDARLEVQLPKKLLAWSRRAAIDWMRRSSRTSLCRSRRLAEAILAECYAAGQDLYTLEELGEQVRREVAACSRSTRAAACA